MEVLRALLEAGRNPNENANHPGKEAASRVLIAAGADANARSDTGETPLY